MGLCQCAEVCCYWLDRRVSLEEISASSPPLPAGPNHPCPGAPGAPGAPSPFPPVPVLRNWAGVGKHRGAQSSDSPHKPHLRTTGTSCPGNTAPPPAGRVKQLGRRHHCLLGGTWGLGSAPSGCWSPRPTATAQDGKEGAKLVVKMIGRCRASSPKNFFSLYPYGLSSGNDLPTPIFIILGTLQAILAIAPCLSCSQLWGKLLLTGAGLVQALQPQSL